mmetsp:Transcript_18462/g.30091  ORF Transcript_18462/g.30091 Transcript_18462/m.30091 type:complete len:229 (-) Transcript_18462:2451-3137(-)
MVSANPISAPNGPTGIDAPEPVELGRKGHEHHPEERERQEDFPPQPHQLVIAVAGRNRLHHRKEEEEERHLANHPQHTVGQAGHRRQPAAKEQQRHQRAHQEDGDIFTGHEEQEGRGGVFHLIARDQFALRFRQVERGPVGLCQGADKEQEDHRQMRQPVPAKEPVSGVLRVHDGPEIHRACGQDHTNDDQTDADLIRNHLRRRAERAEEWIFRVRRPAAHDHAVNFQ